MTGFRRLPVVGVRQCKGDGLAELQEAFAADLDRLRMHAAISIAELARRAGQPASSVGDLLRGGWVRVPPWEQVSSLVRECVAVTPPEVLTEAGEETRRLADLSWWKGQHTDLVRRLTTSSRRGANGSRTSRRKAASQVAGASQGDTDARTGSDLRLDAYLRAAKRFARDLPYPALLDGPKLPPLPEGYIPQQALMQPALHCAPAAKPAEPVVEAGVLVSARDVFTSAEGLTLLIGAPGCGKSALLRWYLLESIEDRKRGGHRGNPAVPVLVPATGLSGPGSVSQAIAAAVATALARHLPAGTALTADLFAGPPHPGGSWLVLVDGLDEVGDHDARADLLSTLSERTAVDGGLYRFVVTTRPLPMGELDVSAAHSARFELQPFSLVDLRDYAIQRFQDLSDPDRHADRFVALVAGEGLEALARVPLIAAMLCSLYELEPVEWSARGRTEIYTRFIDQIHKRNAHKRIADIQQRAIEALEDRFQHIPDRQSVREAAERARDGLPDLVDSLAHRVFFTGVPASLDTLADHPLGRRPVPVAEREWRRFLGDLLRPTGLVTVHGDELSFPHRTFLEYHAASHAIESQRRDWAIREAIGNWLSSPAIWPFGRRFWSMSIRSAYFDPALWAEDPASRMRGEMSYAGFVLDLAERQGLNLWKKLLRIAKKGGAEGATFIVLQTALGTRIPSEIIDVAHHTLMDIALGPRRVPGGERILAAETLVRLGSEHGLDAFAAMADDPYMLHTIDPLRLPMSEIGDMPAQFEFEDARADTGRDTLAKLDAVVADVTLDAAVRQQVARVRAALQRLMDAG